jgi:hypothetical protein
MVNFRVSDLGVAYGLLGRWWGGRSAVRPGATPVVRSLRICSASGPLVDRGSGGRRRTSRVDRVRPQDPSPSNYLSPSLGTVWSPDLSI